MSHRFYEKHPELGRSPIPVEPCISQEVFERERELVFRKVWLNVGRVEEVPKAGDYLVKDIQICNTSALIVRRKDRSIGAYHNVCSHRCNKLVWDDTGNAPAFKCKFHSWVYSLEGKLTSVPDEESFYDLEKENHGLTPMAADVWRGFIFVNLDPNPAQTLTEFLGGFGEQLAPFPFEEMKTCFTWSADMKTNWKVGIDAFQEGYHVFSLHKRSLPGFGYKDNPFGQPLDILLYDAHRIFSQQASPDQQVSPTGEIVSRYATTFASQMTGSEGGYPGTNPTKSPKWVIDACPLFPNFQIHLTNGMFYTYNFWPLAVDRTFFEWKLYYPETKTVGELVSREFSKVGFRDAILEDINTLEATQSVLASGAKTHFILQDNELCVRHAYKVLEDYIGA